MNKKTISFFFILVLSTLLFSQVNLPKPTAHVSDYAKIMDGADRSQLEAKITEYRKLTSVEIAVVTTPSLDGMEIEDYAVRLFEKWGIGKKDEDNGVLVLIAPNERKIRIEVGYGLEPDLPDIKCYRIINDLAIPQFKQGNYSKGAVQAVDGVIATLGKQSIIEREAAHVAMKKAQEQKALLDAEQAKFRREKNKENTQQFFASALVVLLILLPIVGMAFFIGYMRRLFRERKRKALLRKEVMGGLEDSKKKRDEAAQALEKVRELGSFPDWAKPEFSTLLSKIRSGLKRIESMYLSVNENYKKNPDGAKAELDKADDELGKVNENLKRLTVDLPREIKQYEKKAPEAVKSAKHTLQDAVLFLAGARQKGYRFDENGAAEEVKHIAYAESLLQSKSNSRHVVEIMQVLEKRLLSIKEAAAGIIKLRDQNEERISTMPKALSDVQKNIPTTSAILDDIKENNPADNWQSLEKDFLLVAGLIVATKKLLESASSSNSMEKADFVAASKNLQEAESNIGRINETVASVAERKKEIAEAKKSHQSQLSSADSKVSEAERAVHQPDVKSTAKSLAGEANGKLESAKKMLASSSINWLQVIVLLGAATSLAEDAISRAKKDKSDAEEERRARRKREEESSHSSYSSSSYGSSSHDSGGSDFGGFGGGSSGGGGASGSW